MTRAELSILLTADSEIRALNRAYRQVDAATDVLSFPQLDEGPPPDSYDGPLGDVVVSLETAADQAGDGYHQERLGLADWSLDDEILFLLIHGVLHLIGHDHHDAPSDVAMREEEARLFQILRPEAPRPA